MATNDLSWTAAANELEGQGFERFHIELAKYNARQLMPAFPTDTWRDEVDEFAQVSWAEGEYIETVRREISRSWRACPLVWMTSLIGLRSSKNGAWAGRRVIPLAR